MAVRLLIGCYEGDPVALYDSVTGWAFGPTFADEEEAEAFLAYVDKEKDEDARTLSDPVLEALLGEFLKSREGEGE